MKRGLSLIFLFFSTFLFSQDVYRVSGRVMDSRTHEPLAFVNIIINDNPRAGGTTDIDGKFRLSYGQKIRKLTCTYVGYEDQDYTVGAKIAMIQIYLVQKEIELKEVEIFPGINPADRIIRNALANRDNNDPEKLKSFSYTSYDKIIFTVNSDTTVRSDFNDTTSARNPAVGIYIETQPARDSLMKDTARLDTMSKTIENLISKQYLFLMENVTKRKFLYPDKNYNQVIATKMSGFKDPMIVFLTTQIQSFSFYKPFITIFQNTYVNPISTGSLNKYFFKIMDTTYSGKDTTFILRFRPRKGTNFDGLKGTISINSYKWAIQNVIAQPASTNAGFTIRIQQMYELVDGETWFPVQLNTDVSFNNFKIGKYIAIGTGRSYIRDIVLNPEMVRREFNHLDIEVDKDAGARKMDFWNQYRVDSLTAKDTMTYHVIDSIGRADNFDKLAKSAQTILTGRIPFKIFDIDLSRILNYNTYEGIIAGIGVHTNDRLLDWFKIGGFYQYAFAISTSKYGGDVSFLLNRRYDLSIQGGYFYDLIPSGTVNYFDDRQTILSGNWEMLLTKKLDRTENYNLSFTVRTMKYLLLNFGYSNSFKKSTTFDLADKQGDVTLLYDQYRFSEVTAALKWAYGEKFIQTVNNKFSFGTNYPIVWFTYTRGINGFLDGEFDYNRFDLKVKKTFHFKYIGKLTFQFNAGYIDQVIPATNLYYGNASYRMFTLYAPYTFGTMRMNEFLSNKYLSLYLYHDFGYMLFKGKKWFHPEFAISQNIGFGWLDHFEKYAYITMQPKQMDLGYYESGLLINNIVNLRVYTIGIGAFYRWGPYGFKYAGDNFAYKVSMIFPFGQ